MSLRLATENENWLDALYWGATVVEIVYPLVLLEPA